MTLTVSPWLVWGVLSLACCGLWAVLWTADRAVRGAWERWRDRGDLEDGDEELVAALREALDPEWRGELVRAETERLLELPPERSAGELGFTGEQPAVAFRESDLWPDDFGGLIRADPTDWHQPKRERRAPWWEAEHRAAYHALGLDYPSGMLAAIRYHPAGP